MKFSIIIPIYNTEKTLRLCLDAVYKQGYKDFEVIVVDDCSPDNSVQIAKRYPCRLIRLEKNSGPAVARNLGAKNAGGEILLFVDSDIALKPDVLDRILGDFKTKDAAAIVGVYADEPLIKDSLVEEYRILQEHYWKSSTAGYISSMILSIGAIKKKVFFEMGGLDESYKKPDVEDIEFGNRITRKYKIYMDTNIQGYHDSDDKLRVILRNIAKRAGQRVKLFLHRKKFDNQYATPNRGAGVVFSVLFVLSWLLLMFSWQFVIIPVAFLIAFILSDFGMYWFVLRKKGFVFLLYFIWVHFLVNIAIAYGIFRGLMRLLFS